MKIPFWDNRYELWGQYLWNRLIGPSDEFVCMQLQTQAGPVEICYAVFVDAVEALVDVALCNWRVEENEEPIKLYGKVKAKSSMIRKLKAQSTLFQMEKARNQYFHVFPSNQSNGDIHLPLSRKRVVLPRNATLKVYIDIWQCFSDADDRRVAKGKVEFKTKPSKSTERTILTESCEVIPGRGFDVQVKVNWVHDTVISCDGKDSSEEDDA